MQTGGWGSRPFRSPTEFDSTRFALNRSRIYIRRIGMQQPIKKIRKHLCLWVFLLLVLSRPGGAMQFNAIVSFGDSLSDTGNLYENVLKFAVDWELYYQGRLSNGPLWIEYLADVLGLGGALHNFAFAGAKTGAQILLPGLLSQVDTYLGQAVPSPETLFAVWVGAMNFLYGGAQDQIDAVPDILESLDLLARAGAVHILVAGLPDLGATPRRIGSGEDRRMGRDQAINFNTQLVSGLAIFEKKHPTAKIYYVDVFDLFTRIQAQPEDFGFVNAEDANPEIGIDFENNGGYLFWDDIHPSTQAHARVADEAAAMVYTPTPRITANGTGGSLTILTDNRLSIAVALTANYHEGKPVEFWIGASTPAGFYSYGVLDGWTAGLKPCCRSELTDLMEPVEILNLQGLSAGTYTFYMIVDNTPDDLLAPTWFDSVEVRVE